MKNLVIFAFSSIFILSACSKKSDKTENEPIPAPSPVQEAKADNAQDTKIQDQAQTEPEQVPVNEEKQTEAAAEPNNQPEPENQPQPDDDHIDLALDKDCIVTHCKNYKGAGRYWLDCDTENIVKAGFAFGDNVSSINYKNGKPVYKVDIQGRGDNCVTQGHYSDKCFINQNKYIEYIIENQLICNYEDDATTCIYDDDEHKKCQSKKLKFALPNLKNTWGDKADAELTIDELESKYISFWGKRIWCDLENTEGGYACNSFVSGEFCHCNNKGECYCPDGDPVTAGEFPESSCTKTVCNPNTPKDCREVMTACPDEECVPND